LNVADQINLPNPIGLSKGIRSGQIQWPDPLLSQPDPWPVTIDVTADVIIWVTLLSWLSPVSALTLFKSNRVNPLSWLSPDPVRPDSVQNRSIASDGRSELVSSPNRAVFEAVDSWQPVLRSYSSHNLVQAPIAFQIQLSRSAHHSSQLVSAPIRTRFAPFSRHPASTSYHRCPRVLRAISILQC